MFQNNVIYVVGNRFANFSMHDGVYTFSTFINQICNSRNKLGHCFIELGQGLSEEEKDIIEAIVGRNNTSRSHKSNKLLASPAISHKHKIENIMISNPERLDHDDVFQSYLYLNDDCAEMSDHVTGQHIQGMVFTEAARQMMLAVAEKFVLKDFEKLNSYCALTNMSSKFFQFGFPIETKIIHEIEYLNNEKPGRYQAQTTTSFLQNERVIASVNIDYLYNDKRILEKLEALMAKNSLEENRSIKFGNVPNLKAA